MKNPSDNIRIPPHNLDAEKAVLGALLLSEDALGEIVDILKPVDFYEKSHQAIFESVLSLYAARQNVDVVTLSDQMKKQKTLDSAGGVAYLCTLVEFVATTSNAVYYANIVKERSVRRRLIEATLALTGKGYESETETSELLDEAERRVFELSSEKDRQQAVNVKECLIEAIETVERLRGNKEHVTGIPSGFYDLDKITSGFQPSNVIVIGARPSVGKTAFALALITHAAVERNVPVVIFSLEMSQQEITQRLLANVSGVPLGMIRNGYVSNENFPKLTNAASRLSRVPLFIDDSGELTPMSVRSKVRRLRSSQKIGMVVIDYLQLMNSSGKQENRQQEISTISRSIKALAREINVPIIALSQLSRKADDSYDKKDNTNTKRPPELSHLRESGAIEQDADLVLLLHRPEMDGCVPENIGEMQVLVRKHRNGPIGDVSLLFRKDLMRFENRARTDQQYYHVNSREHQGGDKRLSRTPCILFVRVVSNGKGSSRMKTDDERRLRGKGLGMLFYGPPGTGKSMFAHALAAHTGKQVLQVNVSEIKSKWVGASEKNIVLIFKTAREKDCVVCLDEAESLILSRGEEIERPSPGGRARGFYRPGRLPQGERAVQRC